MAAVQSQVSDGTLHVVSVGLPYFEKDDVRLSLSDGVTADVDLINGVDYNWTSDVTITFLATAKTPSGFVPNGITLYLRRTTDSDQMLNVYDGGAPFNRTTLDENFEQLLFLAQEFAGTSGLDAVQELREALEAATGASQIGAVYATATTTVQLALDQVKAALDSEALTRQTADQTLTTNLAAEVAARIAAIATEVTERNAAIAAAADAVSPESFGAVGDGVTNDTAAIQAALNSLGALGGAVLLKKRYLVDSNLNVPRHASLVGTFSPFGGHPWHTAGASHTQGCTIILNSAASIVLDEHTALTNLSIIRKGTTTAEATPALFAGTAIKAIGTLAVGLDGIELSHLQILGFAQAIDMDYAHRCSLESISGDNVAGIRMGTFYDVVRINNIHMWPFHADGARTTLVNHHRGGEALRMSSRNDIPEISNVFSYGYYRGISLGDGVGTATFVNCCADNTGIHPNSIGILIEDNAAFTTFLGCSGYGNSAANYYIQAATGDNVTFTNCRAIGSSNPAAPTQYGFRAERGHIRLINCEISTAVYGVSVSATGQATIGDSNFQQCTTNSIVGVAGSIVREYNNRFLNGAGPSGGWSMTAVASSDPMVVPQTGTAFIVTGTTNFGTLNGGWPGRKVTLIFQSALVVFHGASIKLTGSTQMNATALSTLTLIHDGGTWYEVARSIR